MRVGKCLQGCSLEGAGYPGYENCQTRPVPKRCTIEALRWRTR